MRAFLIALAAVSQVSAFSLLECYLYSSRSISCLRAEPTSSTAEPTSSSAAEEVVDYKTQWEVDDSYTTTASGLKFKDTVEGTDESPEEGATVSLHYAFWFDDFSSSDSKEGTLYFDTKANNPSQEPISFQLGDSKMQIIKGWAEGMETMKKGGKRVLIIPPELGYGTKGLPKSGNFPAIPGSAMLRFEVEMVDVDNSVLTKLRRGVWKPSTIFDGDKSWFDLGGK